MAKRGGQKLAIKLMGSMLALLSFAGCKTVQQKSIDNFTVYQPFGLKDKNGQYIMFTVGQMGQSGSSWQLLVVQNGGQSALVLERTKNNATTDFPLSVPSDFAIGGQSVAASATGQGVGVIQDDTNIQFANDPPTQTTQSCTVTHTEQICRDSSRGQICHTVTITRDGEQSVTVQTNGYTQEVVVSLVSASGDKLASISVFDDETFNTTNPTGPCM